MVNEWRSRIHKLSFPPFKALAASSGISFSGGMGSLGGELGLPRAYFGCHSPDPATFLPQLCFVNSIST